MKVVGGDVTKEPSSRRKRRPRSGDAGRHQRAHRGQVAASIRATHEAPVWREVVGLLDRAPRFHLVDQQLPYFLLPVVNDRCPSQHGVAAAARLAVVVERHCEGIAVADRDAPVIQPRDSRPDRPRRIDYVINAGNDVEVVAGNL